MVTRSQDLSDRIARIRLLIMDCDGVLTDGRLYFGPTGEELKVFHVRDGQGLAMWHAAGRRSGMISGRISPMVELRGGQLGIEFILQGRNEKIPAFNEILSVADVSASEVAFIGDDIPDLPVMYLAGLAVAVADAVEEVRSAAHYVTKLQGGRGAVRETIDLMLADR